MPVARNGSASPVIELSYETFGDPEAEPLLLVMGLGGPMIWWEDGFCRLLADAGFHVVRFDNRDTGRSTWLRGAVSLPTLARAYLGLPVRAPYSLSDLARDGLTVLDDLGLPSAHVVGMSMGGMIAQTMAIEHPTRVRSLTSIMSTTGARTVGWQHPAVLPRLLSRVTDEESYVAATVQVWRTIGSPAHQHSPEVAEARARATVAYGVNPPGTSRQTLAVLTQPDRTAALRELRLPTLVVHGLADRMVHPSGGRATARAVPGAEFLGIRGMGHDLPEAFWPILVEAIARTAGRARPAAG